MRKYTLLSILGLTMALAQGLAAQEESPAPSAPPVSPLPSSPGVSAAAASPGNKRQDALQAYRNRDFQTAIDICIQELKNDPENLDSYSVLGWSLNALRRYPEAIRYTQEGRRHGASDHRLVGILAEAYYSTGNDIQAIAFYQQFISMVSRIPGYDQRYVRDAYRDLAETFARNGEYHHADLAMSSAILTDRGTAALDPRKQAELWLRLGSFRENLGDTTHAREAYNQALTLNPGLDGARAALDRLGRNI